MDEKIDKLIDELHELEKQDLMLRKKIFEKHFEIACALYEKDKIVA